MKNQEKPKSHNCPYCNPANPETQCVLATAKTVIDGKEYSACCSNVNKVEAKIKKSTKKPEK